MVKYSISKNDENQRIDKYVKKILKEAPNSFIYKMMRKKNIVLNGKKCEGNEILKNGDEIKIFLSDETFSKFSGREIVSQDKQDSISQSQVDLYIEAYEKLKIEIIYEDDNTLFVNKPSGVLSQKAKPDDISINEWLIGYLLSTNKIDSNLLVTFKPSICNRLDRNTSGIVACAKTLIGAQVLGKMISSKDLQKYYYCLVDGQIEIQERVQGYLYKDEKINKVTIYKSEEEIPSSIKKDTVYIDTKFSSIKSNDDVTLIEVQLFTGKTHQIRAHLQSLGHPIIGDSKYGNQKVNTKYHAKSQLLHAYKLVFPKIDNEGFEALSNMTLTTKVPKDFTKLINI